MGTGLKFLFERRGNYEPRDKSWQPNRQMDSSCRGGCFIGSFVLTIRPVGAQDAPPLIPGAETVFNYAEKGTGPVTTYRARDPEGNKIFWTLSGTDAGAFTIDGGALRFKSPPDYENPTDGPYDVDGGYHCGTIPPAIASNNIYRVTVRFGAGGEDGMPGDRRL